MLYVLASMECMMCGIRLTPMWGKHKNSSEAGRDTRPTYLPPPPLPFSNGRCKGMGAATPPDSGALPGCPCPGGAGRGRRLGLDLGLGLRRNSRRPAACCARNRPGHGTLGWRRRRGRLRQLRRRPEPSCPLHPGRGGGRILRDGPSGEGGGEGRPVPHLQEGVDGGGAAGSGRQQRQEGHRAAGQVRGVRRRHPAAPGGP